MNVNAIQLDKYAQNTANKAVSKGYSILVNGEKYTVGSAVQNTPAQNQSIKDTTFAGHNANVAKKGYTVLINGERYVVGASKNVIKKSSNATHAIFDMFKKIALPKKNPDKALNVFA